MGRKRHKKSKSYSPSSKKRGESLIFDTLRTYRTRSGERVVLVDMFKYSMLGYHYERQELIRYEKNGRIGKNDHGDDLVESWWSFGSFGSSSSAATKVYRPAYAETIEIPDEGETPTQWKTSFARTPASAKKAVKPNDGPCEEFKGRDGGSFCMNCHHHRDAHFDEAGVAKSSITALQSLQIQQASKQPELVKGR